MPDWNKVATIFLKGLPQFQSVQGKDVFLIMGISGTGCSTIVNYLTGKTMFKDSRGCADVLKTDKDEKITVIGHRPRTQTLYPETMELDNMTLCDCPGLSQSRNNNEEAICAITSLEIVVRLASSIRGILVVIDYQQIQFPQYVTNLLNIFNKIFLEPEASFKSTSFIITKSPRSRASEKVKKDIFYSLENYITELEEEINEIAKKQISFFKREYIQVLQETRFPKEKSELPDALNQYNESKLLFKQQLKCLKSIQKRSEDHLFIVDVFNTEAREHLLNSNLFKTSPLNPNFFDFKSYFEYHSISNPEELALAQKALKENLNIEDSKEKNRMDNRFFPLIEEETIIPASGCVLAFNN